MPFVPDAAPKRGRFVPDAQPPEETWGDVAKGVGENVLSVGTAMATAPVAEGLATAIEAPKPLAFAAKAAFPMLAASVGPLLGGLRRGGVTGDQASEALMSAGTYQPRTATGQRYQENVQSVMEPVGQAVEFVARGGEVGAPSEFGEHMVKTGLSVLGAKPLARPVAAAGRAVAPRAPQNTLPVVAGAAPEAPPRPQRPPPTPPNEPAPTTAQLRDAAERAYRDAEGGPMVPQEQLQAIARKIQETMAEEAIDPTLHPASFSALQHLQQQAARGDVVGATAKGVERIRQVMNKRRSAVANADDGRLLSSMIDDFDEWADNLGGRYAPGRALWTRYRKSVEIEELIQRARDTGASKFTQSGFENALRSEFRALVKNPRRMRKFTPAEQQMIRRVSNGNFGANAVRWLGKFAPTSPLAGASSLGTGVTAGFLAGGPLGAGVGAMLPALGLGARGVSTLQTLNRARAAGETMRRGAPPPTAVRRMPYPLISQPPQRE